MGSSKNPSIFIEYPWFYDYVVGGFCIFDIQSNHKLEFMFLTIFTALMQKPRTLSEIE